MENYNIVYIEDNKFNIKLIQNLAEKLGLNIKGFENPKEGLEYCKTHNIDLLLVDYMMPELNGIDLVSELKKEKPDVPVVMITAINDLQLRKKAVMSGIEAFLPKPINVNDFKETVFKLLNKDYTEDSYIKDILNTEDDMILILESKRIKHVNKSFLNFFDYISEDEVDSGFFRFFVIDNKYAWGSDIDEFIQNIMKKSDLVKIKKDNAIYYFKVKITVYKYKNRVIIIFKDITKLVQLEEKNKELFNKLSDLQKELRNIKEAGFLKKIKLLFGR